MLRDTGRRPLEVLSLPLDCLETRHDQTSLVWDNHKARRHRRRLPITTPTADAIRAWKTRREQLQPTLPPSGAAYLFPALTRLATRPYLHTSYLGETLRHWVDPSPTSTTKEPTPTATHCPSTGPSSTPTPSGTPSRSATQTPEPPSTSCANSWTTSPSARPSATTPSPSNGNVAVPYGGCTEPSNVKAGGSSCPIRFQCAGCGYYRPDPSYLTAIEQHINELRADRETARAMHAAEFVITALTAQISAFEQVADRMRRQIAALPTAERQEIEEASTVLRKVRAGTHTLLPLTVITKEDQA